MLVSFLMSSSATLIVVGGLIAAVAGLYLAVTAAGTKQTNGRAAAGVGLGIALIIVMTQWNDVLAAGLAFMQKDPEIIVTGQESGDVLTDLGNSALILIITLVAVSILTVALTIAISLLVRVLTSSTSRHPQLSTPAPAAPAPTPATAYDPAAPSSSL